MPKRKLNESTFRRNIGNSFSSHQIVRPPIQTQTQHIYATHALLQISNIRRFHSSICSLITYLLDILVDEIETSRRPRRMDSDFLDLDLDLD